MVYLKLFEELNIDDLDLISKKFTKSNYLSASTIKKMEEIGVTIKDFTDIKKRVEYAFKINNLIKNNEELIEILFISLEDMMDFYDIGFNASKLRTNIKVNIDTALSTSYEDRKDIYLHFTSDDMNIVTFDLIKSLLKNKESLYSASREKQKAGNNNWLYKNNRDYGSLTKWKNKSVFEKLKMSFEISFNLELQLPYRLDKYNYYEDGNDAYNTEEHKRISTELSAIRNSLTKEISHIFEKLFYLNDIEDIKPQVINKYSYMDTYLSYDVYFSL